MYQGLSLGRNARGIGGAVASVHIFKTPSWCSQAHQNCLLVDCSPYGLVTSCAAIHLVQLSAAIRGCQLFLPMLSLQAVLTVKNKEEFQQLLEEQFPPLSTNFDDQFYGKSLCRITELSTLAKELTHLPVLQKTIGLCLQRHNTRPVNPTVPTVFKNLYSLHAYITHLKSCTETTFYETLDRYPCRTEVELKIMMRKVSIVTMLRHLTVPLYRWGIIQDSWREGFQTSRSLTSKHWVHVNGWMMRLWTILFINGAPSHAPWALAHFLLAKFSLRTQTIHAVTLDMGS